MASDGVKSYYCLSDERCVTLWKKADGDKYVMIGKYQGREIPSDNYIRIRNLKSDYVGVVFSEDRLLVEIDDKADILVRSSSDLIELYNENKAVKDSLYTYFDGRYRRYKKGINFISVSIKENYATGKGGIKL